jgi:hypothetical protein
MIYGRLDGRFKVIARRINKKKTRHLSQALYSFILEVLYFLMRSIARAVLRTGLLEEPS